MILYIACERTGADKGLVVVVWDRKDYLKEAYKQLEDREVHEELPNDSNVLVNTIIETLEKIRLRGNLSSDTQNYFFVEDKKFAKFYLLTKFISVYTKYLVDQ